MSTLPLMLSAAEPQADLKITPPSKISRPSKILGVESTEPVRLKRLAFGKPDASAKNMACAPAGNRAIALSSAIRECHRVGKTMIGLLLSILSAYGLGGLVPVFQLPPSQSTVPTTPVPKVAMPPVPAPAPATPMVRTDAEKISSARQSIERARGTIEKLQGQLDDPESEYLKAEIEFGERDKKLSNVKNEIASLSKEGKAAEAAKLEETLPDLMAERELAKDRFDIAIRKTRATREVLSNLKARIKSDEEMLSKLENPTPTEASPAPKPAAPAVATVPPAPKETPVPPTVTEKKPEPAVPSALGVPGASNVPNQATEPVPAPSNERPEPVPEESDPEVRQAQIELEASNARLRDAEARTRLVAGRVQAQERSIKTLREMIQIERDAADQAGKAVARITESIGKMPPDPVEMDTLSERKSEAEERAKVAGDRAARLDGRLAIVGATLTELTQELEAAKKDEEQARAEVAERESRLQHLLSPFAGRNIWRRFMGHAPVVLAIVIGTVLLHLVSRQFNRQIVRLVSRNNRRGSRADRENRASTLVGGLPLRGRTGDFRRRPGHDS